MIWLRTLIFLALVPGTVLFYVPIQIASSADSTPPIGFLRLFGAIPIAVGAAIVLWCARDFTAKGRGTPAPFDPPRALVVQGLYRYVRNPMYVGALLVLFGQFLYFQAAALLLYAGAAFLAAHLFVVLY